MNQAGTLDTKRQSETNSDSVVPCRVCGCDSFQTCIGGCTWQEPGLCSLCAFTVQAVAEWALRARRPDKAALWREVERRALGTADAAGGGI